MQSVDLSKVVVSESLQASIVSFEEGKAKYVALQAQFLEMSQDNERLIKKANELEGQASRTDVAWKAEAKKPGADQEKINSEIERAEQLLKEAGRLRATVDARKSTFEKLNVQLAEARYDLRNKPAVINNDYRQAVLRNIMQREDVVKVLFELFTITRALHDQERVNGHTLTSWLGRDAEAWLLLGREAGKQFEKVEDRPATPFVASLPAVMSGEFTVTTPGEWRKLRMQYGIS